MRKWDEVGLEVIATFEGLRQGSMGKIADFSDEHGAGFSYSAPTILARVLELTPKGMRVRIMYLGANIKTGSGTYMKNFSVDTAEPLPEPAEETPTAAGEKPF